TLTLMLVASLTLTQTQAQSSVKRRFEVSENGRLLAAIVTERTGDAQKVSILRHAQPAHVFTNFPTLSAGHVFIGRQKIFAYSSGANLVETSDCSFAASDNARKGCRSATAIRQRLADDMRLLRAVRPYDTNVEIQEVLFVIATGDDSLLQAEPPASLQVFERTLTDAAAAKASSQIRVAALKARAAKAMQGASPGTLEGCIDGCKENREMCLKDSGVRDKSACYSGYYTCYNNCQSKYAPAPMESAFD
ncbi:MAG TPA: hypothetical protein VNA19_01945, partial [Pyrinomonadaceae bacterium]|nr:hypothetical protein [Pyrinomonadaceae bacterium]